MFKIIDTALDKIQSLSGKVVRDVDLLTIYEIQDKADTEIEDLMGQ